MSFVSICCLIRPLGNRDKRKCLLVAFVGMLGVGVADSGGRREVGEGRRTSWRWVSGCLGAWGAAGVEVGMSTWHPVVYTAVHTVGLNRVVVSSRVSWAVPCLVTSSSVWPWLSHFRELWILGWNKLLELGRNVSLSLTVSLNRVRPDVSMTFISHLCYWTNCKCVYW